ncbi:AraC family transcriptional regulator [Anaerosolibacter carboniphilus]|uniref:AraC family transcriptional regulator n=1 Tax=Anaerosolibacter carboniphilus TaxID=1417629 RepID=A0A841KT68_9FIRM|nr:AraC family transcriptional regulator [Anaerosolibacter carboniphilus]MBB6215348.1 AraC family transcriptional regulator [Anaerosolibacter carboniphilus]
MQWIERINDVINYIEEHLDREISYDKIAEISVCSVYNFQRMFSYIADKSLSEYIRNRRLTLAAFDILNSEDNIIDIAMKYGYTSHDSFTRAFQKFHGVLPSKVRTETIMLKSCPKISFQITIKGEVYMNYKIEQWPAFTISGIRKRMNTDEAFQIIPQLWETAGSDGTMQRLFELLSQADMRPAGLLGVSAGGQWGNSEEMNYYLGVTTHVDSPDCAKVIPHDSMDELSLSKATWAIFEANGSLPEAVQNIYKKFYTEWLPNSGYDLDDLPVIECYLQDNKQEVWIAIKPRD